MGGMTQPDAVERMAQVLSRAMTDDPLNLFVFPDPELRRRALPAMYRLIARMGVRARAIRVTSPRIEGLALWELPGRPAVRFRDLWGAGALRFLRVAGPARAGRLGRYEAWAARRMSAHAPRGSAHLLLLAVDPSEQGKGWASRLVRPVLARLDAEGAAACLETQNPANVPIYEHLGFRVARRATVPGSAVRHWVMVRPPVLQVRPVPKPPWTRA